MSTAPERTLPQTIEQAMSDLLEWSCEPEEVQGVYKENLRHAIRAAFAVADAARAYMYCNHRWSEEEDRLLLVLRNAVDDYNNLTAMSSTEGK